MNLTTLVRLLVVLTVGWTAVSLGAGALGVISRESREATFFLPRPALADAIAVGKPDVQGMSEYKLLDQTNGRLKSLNLPKDAAWSLLSVSPWRTKDGKLEAAGRWFSRRVGEEAACGIGFVTLSGQSVKKLITLDALPTGKPCWLPNRPGEILFPAGDGRLYRCNIAAKSHESGAEYPEEAPATAAEIEVAATALNWDAEIPGAGVVAITDPAVLPEPAFGHLLFVALGVQSCHDGQRTNLPTKLWWLALDDDGEAIVKAGRLLLPGPANSPDELVFERFPHVVGHPNGKLSLVYLERTAPNMTWALRACALELDPSTSLPRVAREDQALVLAKGLRPDPLIVSAQGDTVYAVDCDGEVVAHAIPR